MVPVKRRRLVDAFRSPRQSSPGHVPGLLHVHLPGGEIALVPHHHHRHLLCVLDPLDLLPVGRDVLERLDVVDGEHDEESLPGPHVLVPHGAILLHRVISVKLHCSRNERERQAL